MLAGSAAAPVARQRGAAQRGPGERSQRDSESSEARVLPLAGFPALGIEPVSDKAANRSGHAGERSEVFATVRLIELLQLFSAPSSVSLLDGCGVKRFSNKEALLWSLQHCF